MCAPEHAQVVRPPRDILERAGPSAPDVPDAALLRSLRGEPRAGERGGEAADVPEVIFGEPASAVEDDRNRVRAFAFRQAQFAELQRVTPVGDPVARGGDGQLIDVPEIQLLRTPGRAAMTSNRLSVMRTRAFTMPPAIMSRRN